MPYIGNQPSDLVVPTPTVDTFTGNGSQDSYTLVRAVNNAALLEVFVDNVQQQPTVAYSVSGTTLTFTEPPANGTSIYIIYRDNPTYPLLTVLDNTVNTAAIVDNAVISAKIASVANTKISGNIISSQITSVANTQITGNIIASQIQPTGVTASTYGNASIIPSFVVDTGGRITSASNVAVDFVRPSIASTFTATQTFSGATDQLGIILQDSGEVVTANSTAIASSQTINYDITTQSVLFYTANPTSNWEINFRGSSSTTCNTLLSSNTSATVAMLVNQGATAYYNSNVKIDGSTSGVTTKWLNAAPTGGNASSIDVYVYSIIKTGSSTYTVLASLNKYT